MRRGLRKAAPRPKPALRSREPPAGAAGRGAAGENPTNYPSAENDDTGGALVLYKRALAPALSTPGEGDPPRNAVRLPSALRRKGEALVGRRIAAAWPGYDHQRSAGDCRTGRPRPRRHERHRRRYAN